VLRQTLRRKLDVLIESLRAQFGDAVEFEYPPGGIFLWVKLLDRVDTTRLQQLALAAGVAVNPGVEWTTDGAAGKRRIRICFAHPPEEVIREAIVALAEVCHREFGVPSRGANVHR
jgi:2-aminoadipate transaminase